MPRRNRYLTRDQWSLRKASIILLTSPTSEEPMSCTISSCMLGVQFKNCSISSPSTNRYGASALRTMVLKLRNLSNDKLPNELTFLEREACRVMRKSWCSGLITAKRKMEPSTFEWVSKWAFNAGQLEWTYCCHERPRCHRNTGKLWDINWSDTIDHLP